MEEAILKDLHLHDELQSSVKLIKLGFGEFQNLNLINNFYYLPFQLLSSGFERLMKCHICLGYHEQNNEYPNDKYLKGCGGKGGHDLLELKKSILESYFSTKNILLLHEDFNLLTNDDNLETLIYLLSEFGKYSRYYNLDIVTSAEKSSINVQQLWGEYESNLITSNTETLEKLGNLEATEEVLGYTKRQILIKLEKFTRAICRQFTIGQLGKKALQYSPALYDFILLKDEDLGNQNYRLQTTTYQKKEQKVHQRTLVDELQRTCNPRYRYAIVRKEDFDGDWPFYHNEVTIECREKYWCVVTIEAKDYALNGAAAGRYKLESVHDAGIAILGKSVEPFIQMALQLGEEILC
ncbi:MAG: hypothetical protein B0A82_08070 [Alkalinema sp. CACIAM 70d]|nr:MAG: hypothetical protein B0A82_08070 [Alkalinema sp. CACIAM 70d]